MAPKTHIHDAIYIVHDNICKLTNNWRYMAICVANYQKQAFSYRYHNIDMLVAGILVPIYGF